ncbi:hypothetical protein [Halomonas sp. HAL1]|uniref:hypothetical protein n=1 Tax=Halomonadaceae TaxID=28256 RepID=UPI00022D2776|nr:hypothetical protein [Halomonas sp. HAL1]EHA15282.1 hypothetical protein HAL1_12224 [Halomonas sp. HAL1]WKV95057.1 hypothetical protein Q3Y66_20405 [Halomonas sp. HAL1]
MSLMGYRSTLLRSVIALTAFYSLAATTSFYFMGPETLQEWLAGAGFWVEGESEINPANAASAATEVVVTRLRVVWPWLAGGMAAGSTIVMLMVGVGLITRRQRAKSRGEFRGMDLSITNMPCPDPVSFKPIKAQLAGSVPAHHMPLINQLLGYLQAHPDAFCGDGHSTTLLEHHLGVIDEAFEYEGADPLLPLAAAAHDIGKTVSHAKQNGEWVRLSYHDKESGRLLAKFPAWWELPEDERSILLLAVKYEHSPNLMPVTFPGLCSKGMRRAVTLLQQLRDIDGLATRGEKRRVLETLNVQDLAIETFLRVVPQVPYQVKGLAKRIKAAGFRVGERLYLSEHHIRETALSKLDDDVAAAFGGDFRARGQAGEFTQVLLAALADRGWLITTIEGVPEGSEKAKTWAVPADQALWRVRSGFIEFRGMIAVELPVEHQGLYPQETAYEVMVLGPQGKNTGSAGVAPTKDSGRREERMTKPKGIPASDVCEINLFASAPTGPKPGGDTAQKAEQQSDSSGGNTAQESAEAASKAATPSTKSVTKTEMAGAWLLDDPVTTGGDTAQEETRQTSPSGGNVAQKDKRAQKQQAPAKAASGEQTDSAGAWLLEDAPGGGGNVARDKQHGKNDATLDKPYEGSEGDSEGAWLLADGADLAGGNIARVAPQEPISLMANGGNVASIAEQTESTGESDDGGQVATPSGADNHSDISAELDDWSPEVEDAPNEANIIPGQGEAVPATVEHEQPVTQPTAEDGSWLLSEEPNDSPQPVDPVEGKTQGSPQAAPADKAETASGAAEQLEAAESGQDDAEPSSPIQRRLKKRGGAVGRQGRKASTNEAPADQGKQASQAKASKGSAKPGGAKAEVNGVPKLFS